MSTIIIRLQNLPLSAKAADIREFFGDLKIPKGSVNIVGGPNGDAFIGFQTDEDARLAMLLDGRLLHKANIHLMLSSKREMDQVIANAQAMAGAGTAKSSASALQIVEQKVDGDVKRDGNDGGGPWKMEAAVVAPSAAAQQALFAFGSTAAKTSQSTPAAFLPPQFVDDSWKTPQQKAAAISQQSLFNAVQAVQQQQQQAPMSAGPPPLVVPPVFPGGGSIQQQSPFVGGIAASQPPPQHHYQQLGLPPPPQQPQQPPGFAPPLNVVPPPQQQQQTTTGGSAPQQLRPSFPPMFGGEGFFNQQQQQQANSLQKQQQPRLQASRNFGGQTFGQQGQQQQQQQFGHQQHPGRFGAPQQQFRHPQQQQQFGRREPTRPAGGGFRAQFAAGGIQPGGGHFQQQNFQRQSFQHKPPPQQQQQQQQQQYGGGAEKRHRSRSPNAVGKRPFLPSHNVSSAQFAPANVDSLSAESLVKERVCVQLANIPYKATFNDVKQYLASTNAECVKVTRVYQSDRNYSDRWIVEFDNETDARAVIRHRGEVNNRTIRADRIPPRKADEQYAISEPEEKEAPKRAADDSGGRRERERDRGRDRGRERTRRDSRDRGSDRSRSKSPARQRDRGHDERRDGEKTASIWAKDENEEKEEGRRSVDEMNKGGERRNSREQTVQNPMVAPTLNPTVTPNLNFISNAAAFGAFAFPDKQNNAVYRPKTGGTAPIVGRHFNGKEGPTPLRAFELFPAPPSSTNPRPLIPLMGGNAQKPSTSLLNQNQPGQIPPLIRPASTGFWPNAAASAPPFGAARHVPPAVLNNNATSASSQPTSPTVPLFPSNKPCPPISAPFNSSAASLDLDITGGSSLPGLVIQEDCSMDEMDSKENEEMSQNTKPDTNSIFSSKILNGIPDQPPLDLLEPEADLILHQLAKPASAERRSFDSAPNREFTAQELELRPCLVFLEKYKENPEANSCIRLENVPRMVYADQLSEFLGVQLTFPLENIARMQNGVLYINLSSEALATKATHKNMQFLAGNQIAITQLKRAEMAEAIRQNMIIIREMYRVSVVVRGFPLIAQPNDVIALFERFNLNKDGVEKCAVKPTDTASIFLLTFPSAQDCHNAIQQMNNTQIAGGARIQVFQP